MHFYAVYALARTAGIRDGIAGVIAYSSQFVDDAIDQESVLVTGNGVVFPDNNQPYPV